MNNPYARDWPFFAQAQAMKLGPKGDIQNYLQRGAVAEVETGANVGRRFTVTRLALLGPFALGVPKKTGSLFITLTLPNGSPAAMGEVKVKHESKARQWAAAFNARTNRNKLTPTDQ